MSLRFSALAALACTARLASAQQYEYPPPQPPIPQQIQPQDECTTTTTTTTRCTGRAAPLAVPPVEAAPVFQPPPVYPYQQPAPTLFAPPPSMGTTLIIVPQRGWYMVRDPDGSIWREREVRTPSSGLLGAGLGIFLSSWLATTIGGGVRGEGWASVPIIGAMSSAIIDGFSRNNGVATGLYAFSTIAQATGFILAMIGTGSGPKKKERMPVTVGPSMLPNGGGFTFSGRF